MIPDTSAYMIAGYAVFFVVMVVYILSLLLRRQKLEQELDLLEDLDEKK